MLGMKTYSRGYIDACRARVNANLRAYRKQVGQAPSKDFEARFFNDQVLLLVKLKVGDDARLRSRVRYAPDD